MLLFICITWQDKQQTIFIYCGFNRTNQLLAGPSSDQHLMLLVATASIFMRHFAYSHSVFVCHNMNCVGFGFKLYSVSPYLRLLPLQSWTFVYSIWCHHVLKHWQFCCFFPETHVKPILGTVFTGFAIPAGWRGVRGTHSRWNGIGLDCGSSVCCRHPHFADCSTHRLHSVIDVIINCSDTVLMEFHIDRPI